MGVARSVTTNDHLAGKDRHNYGHEMTPDGLPAALPGRLTESKVWREHRIWPWIGWTHSWQSSQWVPLDSSGVHLHSLHLHIADLVLGLY